MCYLKIVKDSNSIQIQFTAACLSRQLVSLSLTAACLSLRRASHCGVSLTAACLSVTPVCLSLQRVSLSLKPVSFTQERLSLSLKHVSLLLKSVSLSIKHMSLSQAHVSHLSESLSFKLVSLSLKRVSLTQAKTPILHYEPLAPSLYLVGQTAKPQIQHWVSLLIILYLISYLKCQSFRTTGTCTVSTLKTILWTGKFLKSPFAIMILCLYPSFTPLYFG